MTVHGEKMRALSRKLDRPLGAGSDTHQSFQYGCVWNEFRQTVHTVQDLAAEITNGAYEIRMSDSLAFKVESAGILKRALKEIDALGGDYVSVLLKGQRYKEAEILSRDLRFIMFFLIYTGRPAVQKMLHPALLPALLQGHRAERPELHGMIFRRLAPEDEQRDDCLLLQRVIQTTCEKIHL